MGTWSKAGAGSVAIVQIVPNEQPDGFSRRLSIYRDPEVGLIGLSLLRVSLTSASPPTTVLEAYIASARVSYKYLGSMSRSSKVQFPGASCACDSGIALSCRNGMNVDRYRLGMLSLAVCAARDRICVCKYCHILDKSRISVYSTEALSLSTIDFLYLPLFESNLKSSDDLQMPWPRPGANLPYKLYIHLRRALEWAL